MSTITPDEYFERIHRIVSLLDDENTRIIRTMKQHGPRNILNIARESKLPYTTVYSRVVKLESMGVLRTWIQPRDPRHLHARPTLRATAISRAAPGSTTLRIAVLNAASLS